MKRIISFLLVTILCTGTAHSQEKKTIRGFDGGMMIHTGYIHGNIIPLNHEIAGAPLGIGGVIHLHLGEHCRIGSEGYVSKLNQMGNGSYIKYGWGGILGDFYWTFGRFMPYFGITLGGGALTSLLMTQSPESEWEPIGKTYFNKKEFVAIDPFVGCDFIISEALHLTLKTDYLQGFGKNFYMPTGARIYVGVIFYH